VYQLDGADVGDEPVPGPQAVVHPPPGGLQVADLGSQAGDVGQAQAALERRAQNSLHGTCVTPSGQTVQWSGQILMGVAIIVSGKDSSPVHGSRDTPPPLSGSLIRILHEKQQEVSLHSFAAQQVA